VTTFSSKWFIPTAIIGIISTLGSLYVAFAGGHGEYGVRALGVILCTLIATAISFHLSSERKMKTRKTENIKISEDEILAQLGNAFNN
jgi:hypothetical protein